MKSETRPTSSLVSCNIRLSTNQVQIHSALGHLGSIRLDFSKQGLVVSENTRKKGCGKKKLASSGSVPSSSANFNNTQPLPEDTTRASLPLCRPCMMTTTRLDVFNKWRMSVYAVHRRFTYFQLRGVISQRKRSRSTHLCQYSIAKSPPAR